MPRPHRLLAFLALASACKDPKKTVPPDQIPGMDPNEHLLLTPSGDPESLLGRTADPSADGKGWIISDSRAPGCEVTVRRVPELWTRQYSEDLGRAAVFSAGREQIGGLAAEYGKQIRVDATIDNTEVLHADVRNCAGNVVTSVKVGTGTRQLQYRREMSAKATANVKGVPVGASGGQWERIGGTLDWKVPQAWSFTVGSVAGAEGFGLDFAMPTEVTDGETFDVKVSARRSVYLVAIEQAANGDLEILLPNMKVPNGWISGGESVSFAMTARMVDPSQPQNHTKILIWAFAEQGDFDLLRPPAGALAPAEVVRYHADLPAKLSGIPQRRWASSNVSYVVKPGASALPATGQP